MLKSSSLCLYSSNLITFWLKIEQFWQFEEIFIFGNSGHLGYRTALTDTILKGDHPRIMSAKIGMKLKKKSSPLKLLSQSQPNFAEMILGWSSSKILQLAQWFLRRRFLCEFPIGSYVKLSSAVGAILIEGPNRRTHFWKRTIQ
jgi:hypothetical protein